MEIETKPEQTNEEPRTIPDDFNFHISISFFPKDGKMELKTNINDLFIAMGLWEVSKDILKSKISSENRSRVVKPNGGLVNFVRGLKN